MSHQPLLILDCTVSPASGRVFEDAVLRLAPPGLDSVVLRMADSAGPAALAERAARLVPAALLISGSEAGVHEGRPWVRILRDQLRVLTATGLPTLGICFGHQILAAAWGGEVETPRPARKVRGIRALRITDPSARWLGGDTIEALVSHTDQVVAAPPGWSVAACSDYCPIQALSAGDLPIVGVQWHPEADRAFIEDNPEPDAGHPWNRLDQSSLAALGGVEVLRAFLAHPDTRPPC